MPWVSLTETDDTGLEEHAPQPRQASSNWLGQRRGRISDPFPGHESA